jgi:hypothetical protein
VKDRRIGFLFYENRSGSTYLASLLDSHPEVLVTLEANFPDYVFGLGKDAVTVATTDQLQSFIEPLYNDIKFRSWEVAPEELLTTLLGHNKLPFPTENIFETIIDLYIKTNKPDAKICIYKDPKNLQHYPQLKSIFPSALFLHIYRDGRAVYNSRKQSLGSKTGRPMEVNPIAAAYRWARIMKMASEAEKNDRFCSIRYENLIRNAHEEMKDILKFLSVSAAENIDDMLQATERYFDKIPEQQKHLHANIKLPPRDDRIDFWRQALPAEETYLYEKYARKSLTRHGYELVSTGSELGTIQWLRVLFLYGEILSRRLRNNLASFKRATLGFIKGDG